MTNRRLLFGAALALVAACTAAAADLRITGPYTHDNLSIYLLHRAAPDSGTRLLTLEEAMVQQKVTVYETSQVNELSIENRSAQEVYVQAGDIVKGGKQDRVLMTDLILPPHSGRIPIGAFCVEHGRWTKRGDEAAGQFSGSSRAVPFKSVKLAVRDAKSQTRVWAEVQAAQDRLGVTGAAAAALPSPTSMQLTLESKNVAEQTAGYVRELAGIVEREKDVVGFAYAVNGVLNSAEIYASADLFRRMWPKMLQASADDAVGERREGKSAAAPATAAVMSALDAADAGRAVSRDTTGSITVAKKESGNTILFETRQGDAWLHKSYVVK